MTASSMLKQELHTKLEQLPTAKLQEVLDFVSFLLFQQGRKATEEHPDAAALQPEHDPLLKFIGAVSHGALAHGIDEEVYGV